MITLRQRNVLLFAKKSSLIVLALLKSFFLAVTTVAWGIASLFFFNILIAYMLKDGIPFYVSKMFLQLEHFLITNIMPFVWVFFVLLAFFEIKEVLKK